MMFNIEEYCNQSNKVLIFTLLIYVIDIISEINLVYYKFKLSIYFFTCEVEAISHFSKLK